MSRRPIERGSVEALDETIGVRRADPGLAMLDAGEREVDARWIVDRTFAWFGRCRRLAKVWEKSIASSEAWISIAHIRLTTRRITKYWVY